LKKKWSFLLWKKGLPFIIFLFGLSHSGVGQEKWDLRSDKDSIYIYTRSLPDSKFKAIKVECELSATLSQLVAVLLDVNRGAEWVYSTKSSVLLKQVSPSEIYYYSEVDVPWPASNRDFIARLKVVQDSATKVVTVYGPTYPDYLPAKKGIVRVPRAEGKWVITPVGRKRIKVMYTLNTDPGGDIPAWLINLFATKGPSESFRNLRVQLRKAVYAAPGFGFIRD
jgi:hypothetical protein